MKSDFCVQLRIAKEDDEGGDGWTCCTHCTVARMCEGEGLLNVLADGHNIVGGVASPPPLL